MTKAGGAAAAIALAAALFLGGTLLPGRGSQPSAATKSVDAETLLAPGQSADLDQTLATLQNQIEEGGPKLAEQQASLAIGYLQKARVEAEPSFYDEAEAAIQASFEAQPDGNFSATIARAILAGSRHDFHGQVRWGQRAVAINRFNSQAHGIVGDGYLELGQEDKAFESYQRSIDLRPDLSSFGRLSAAAQTVGDTRGAIDAMERALGFAGTSKENAAWAHWQLGELFIGNQQFETAEGHLDQALTLAPDFNPAVESTVHLTAARGDIKGAIVIMEPLVEDYPLPGNSNFLGELYLLAGDEAAAASAFKEADRRLRLYEEHDVRPDVDFATFWSDRGIHLDRALQVARKLYSQRTSAAASDALAWALYANGRYSDATPYAREAIRRSVNDAGYHYHAGMIARELGHEAEARGYLKTALDLDPSWSIIESHRARNVLSSL
ncbi:MAG: tetratricopeptide repeat protein [Actinomycetota bacterium]|nr:tetratricopeptide repeat protein [Actinomycetota bacterium]